MRDDYGNVVGEVDVTEHTDPTGRVRFTWQIRPPAATVALVSIEMLGRLIEASERDRNAGKNHDGSVV